MTSSVVVEAYPDRTFRGTVEKIEPQAEVQQNVTMFPVIVNLDNRSGLLRPGMNAEVTILVDQANNVVLVPNSAIVQVADVGPAALALGLDVENLDLSQFMRAGRGGVAGQAAWGAGAATEGAPAAGAPAQGEGENPMARIDSLRARVDRGEISQDSMRTIMQGLRAEAAAGANGTAEEGVSARQTRPAVVFVMNDAGRPEPRLIQMGLNDWDNTQAVSGVDEGTVLAVVGAAQLQARQQEFLNMIRSRTGGSPFGGGGGGRGPR